MRHVSPTVALVGIVIPAFNAAETIAAALSSLVAQSLSDWVAVVVDDGSTDDTVAVVNTFNDPRISVLRQGNAGVSAARNAGLAAIRADMVLLLDADDWLAVQALSIMTQALSTAPDAVAAAGSYARVRLDGQIVETCRLEVSGRMLERLLTRNLFANGGHVLIRSEAAATAGSFRSDLRYGEDWEFWVRLALLGRFVPTPASDVLCFVRERPDGASGTMARDPAWYRPCLNAIHANPALEDVFGPARLAVLRRHAQAECHWSIGRELIRHGQARAGRIWLARSFRQRPTLRRLLLLGAIRCLGLVPSRWRRRFGSYHPTLTPS